MARPTTFQQACQQFPNRYTLEHFPDWARDQAPNGKYYAPQFATDKEWYDNTKFEGEYELSEDEECFTSGQTWPLGQWLDQPFYTRVQPIEAEQPTALDVDDCTNLRTLLFFADAPANNLSKEWKTHAEALLVKLGKIRDQLESNGD